MLPTLQPGDELFFSEERSFSVGDIVGFRWMGKGIVHRIKKMDSAKIFTKGDNCSGMDSAFITKADIYGKLINVKRGGKRHAIQNGFWGNWIGKKCSAVKTAKSLLGYIIRSVCGTNAMSWVLYKMGQAVIRQTHFSIFKQTDQVMRIYFRKRTCGYYNLNKQELILRNRFRTLFSQRILEQLSKSIQASL